MIIAIVGRRGQGKSALATYRALQAHRKGIEIYANYSLKIPHRQYIDMKYISSACVFLDEGYLYADARRSMSNANVFLSQAIAQCRKNGNTLYFITQSSTWLDQRIRWNFDILDICRAYNAQGKRKLFDKEKIGWINVTRVINSVEKPIVSGYRFYPGKASVFDLYEPYEVIEKERRALNAQEKKALAIDLCKQGFSTNEIHERFLDLSIKISKAQIREYTKETRHQKMQEEHNTTQVIAKVYA